MPAIAPRPIGVNIPDLVRLLGKNLYGTTAVVIRELIQNSYDAVSAVPKRKSSSPPRIDLRGDPRGATLEIVDTGVGMDRQDLETCLSRLAESSKRLQSQSTIGEYGIGFFSAFMIADEIEVATRKGPKGESLVWRSVGIDAYSLEGGASDAAAGTSVRLKLRPNASEFSGVEKLRSVLTRYCNYLDCAIHINDSPTPQNGQFFIWELKEKATRSRWLKDLLGFEPPFWETVRLSSSGTQLVMYLCEEKPLQHIYSKRMFVTDSLQFLDDLDFVGVVLNSPNLLLTLSRESIKLDGNFSALTVAVKQSIEQWLPRVAKDNFGNTRLARVAKGHQETFRRICAAGRDAVPRLHALVFFEVAGSSERLTVLEYLARPPAASSRKVFYVRAADGHGAHSLQVSAYRQQGIFVFRVPDEDEEHTLRRICTHLDVELVELGGVRSVSLSQDTDDAALVHLLKAAEFILSKPVKLRNAPSHLPLTLEAGGIFLNPRNPFIGELSRLRVSNQVLTQLLGSLFAIFAGLDSVNLAHQEGQIVGAVMRVFDHWKNSFSELQATGQRLRQLEEPWWQPAQVGRDGALLGDRASMKCLLAYPFQPSYEDFKAIAVEVCRERRVTATDAGVPETKPLLEKVCAHIHQCDFAIVDISENNPNVLFEFGLLMARRKPVVVTRNKKTALTAGITVPVDIVSIERVEYENVLIELKDKLGRVVSRLVGQGAS